MIAQALSPSDPLMPRKEAARYLSGLGLAIAPQTLARKFHEGAGPLCTRIGRRAMYRQSHLDAYFAAQLCAPSQSASEARASAAEAVTTRTQVARERVGV